MMNLGVLEDIFKVSIAIPLIYFIAYIDAANRFWYLPREYKSRVKKEVVPVEK